MSSAEPPDELLLQATFARRCRELHVKFFRRVAFWLGAVSYMSGSAALASALNNFSAPFSVLAAAVFALFQFAEFKVDPSGAAAAHRMFCREYERLVAKRAKLSDQEFEDSLNEIRGEDNAPEVESVRFIAQHEDLIEHGMEGEAYGKYRLNGLQQLVRWAFC